MSSASSTTSPISSPARIHHLWKSPLPYLFGSLGLMLVVISVALVILFCSYRKPSLSEDEEEEKPAKPLNAVLDDERKIAIVIMAGEDMPTHLATEIIITSPTCYCSCSSETDQKA
ncbi:PREDICTED: GLUTAMINE DUMPER [Prunus dulcis]|uniref:PREDICTED: GLUTAMINE DUMPER n=1 Tax=Prunus dulcis TaxID=3755 RepID=A0A5E4EUI0_PRUDU|nr:hypothetical protein L3X38_019940 [Prunus dulcis]VVA19106.1 PREDICTED: GLUTAMINE DUMPER [Prunus dulcis]